MGRNGTHVGPLLFPLDSLPELAKNGGMDAG